MILLSISKIIISRSAHKCYIYWLWYQNFNASSSVTTFGTNQTNTMTLESQFITIVRTRYVKFYPKKTTRNWLILRIWICCVYITKYILSLYQIWNVPNLKILYFMRSFAFKMIKVTATQKLHNVWCVLWNLDTLFIKNWSF